MNKDTQSRIALVSNTLSAGGAEHVAANLSRFLSRRFEVDLILNDRENIDYDYCGNIIDLGMPADADRSSAVYQITSLMRRTRLLRKLKRDKRYRAVISFSDNTNMSNALSAGAGGSCKSIVSIRYSLKGMEESEHRALRSRRRVLDTCCSKADMIVSCSKQIDDELVMDHGLDPGKLRTIYNGIDLTQIGQEMSQGRADTALVQREGQKLIVTAGRLTAQKGHQHLIRAMKHLSNKEINAKLIILGEGEKRPELEHLVQELALTDRVSMPGRVDHPYTYMRAADAVVMPSEFEGFCNVLVEALACGAPCISTDHKTGAREILAPDTDRRSVNLSTIEHAEYGVLVPVCKGPTEEAILAASIEEMLTDQTLNDIYRQAGPERAAQLDIHDIYRQWIEIIDEQ
ncbi:MAG: glycosyltransferase [Bacillota bacterium]|nr:glycosyltransferase [Bacillota bacterium]